MFKKRRGFATTSGQDYEVALCCLIFLRALRHASDFFLASNYAPAGRFDDVVLYYRTKEDPSFKYRAILLQAKHKENTAQRKITKNNSFRLKQYFDSYKKIRKLWEQPVNVQGQQIDVHEILLVLYTNGRRETNDAAHDVTDSPDVKHLRDILNTGGRLLRISDAERAGLPRDPETSDFIDKFIFCTQQMSVEKVDQTLKEEIINVLRLSSLNAAQNIVSGMKHEIKEWWEGKDEGRYLTKQSHEWTKIIEMQVTRLNGDNLLQMNFDFSDKGLEVLNNISGHKQCWVYVRDKYHATATRVRLFKALKSCLLLDSKFLKEHVEEVEVLWGTDVCSTLVLDTSEDSLENLSLLLESLQMAASSHAGRRLVVVSTEKQNGADWFVREAQATWSVLDPESQENLLSVLVDLQGKVVALRDVVGSEASLIMSEEVILKLDTRNVILKLGASFPTQLEYYVPRCIQKSCTKTIKYDKFKKSRALIFTEDKIIVGGRFKLSTVSELKSIHRVEETRIIVEVSTDSEIRNLCCRFCVPGFSRVTGPEGLVMQFIPFTFLCEEKVVVVEGDPGVGKSSFVTDMCSRVKERFPECWVVRVDMGKHSEFIRQRDFTNASDIKAFLLNGLPKGLNCLATNFVLHSLYVTGNVFLFLDAFDEISPDFTTKCCDLLKRISDMVKYRQLVVTTRPVTTKQVEEALGTKAFHLPVFSVEEQKLFLQRYCKTSGKIVNDEEITELGHSVGPVLEIPLLCKLAAEVLLLNENQVFIKFLNPWRKVFLYQLFVKQYINNCLSEKFGLEVSKPGVKRVNESISNEHLENLQALAVRKLMPINQHSTFDISLKLPEEKLGLVVDNGECVEFEHQTFAEYFFGCWLAQHWQECPKELLNVMFLHCRYEFVLQAMSWFLFEDIPLHKAVAQGDVGAVGRLLSPGTTDRGGRSALHVAAMTQGVQMEVVHLLMSAGEDIKKKDDVFCSDAVRYVKYFRNWEFVEEVLKSRNKYEALHFITDRNTAFQAILHATKQDLTNLFQFLSSQHNIQFDDILDHRGNTLLHVAAINNSTGVIKLILENNNVVNIQTKGKTALRAATDFGCTEGVKMLLKFGADPNIKDADGRTALMFAAANGDFEIVKLLLEKAAALNINDADGMTELMFAALGGKFEIVKLLLEKGADPNIRSTFSTTALIHSIFHNRLENVKLLLEKGADPNIKNMIGWTALMLASKEGHLEIVKLLLQEGADPTIRDIEGKTALMIAGHNRHRDVVKVLLENVKDIGTKY